MKQWNSYDTNFVVWANSHDQLREAIQTYLFQRHSDRLLKSDYRFTWRSPYSDTQKTVYDKQEAIDSFKSHLYDHVKHRVKDDKHIAERIGWNGNIQINSPPNNTGSDILRTHFHSHADLSILISSNPEQRIRHLHDELNNWPERTIFLSTDGHPFDDSTELDFSGVSVELVELDSRLGPGQVGETISRILDVHYADDMVVSLEVDIFFEIIQSFDLKRSCEFVKMLSSRIDDVNGVFQLYVDPNCHPNVSTAMNFLEDEFDVTISASEHQFVRGG